MKWLIVTISICVALGMIYGKLAAVFHWYLPPDWLSIMTGAYNAETQMDLAYISLYIDSALVGAVLYIIL
jgi:hypothetical protein